VKLTKKVSEQLTSIMVEGKLIPSKEKELYVYCFDYIFELAFVIITFVFISIILNRFLFGCIFLLIVFPLRNFGGGIHASNSTTCAYLSYIIYVITIIACPYIAIHYSNLWFCIFIVECTLIMLIAPVDTPNKRLSSVQKRTLKQRSCFFLFIIFILFLVLYYLNLRLYYGSISICGIIPTTSIILGYIKNKMEVDSNVT